MARSGGSWQVPGAGPDYAKPIWVSIIKRPAMEHRGINNNLMDLLGPVGGSETDTPSVE